MKKGFTLIELLVVVLIIGILAAVALPQYQKAVRKSRYASLKPVVKAVKDAQELYFDEHGHYATESELDDLDIDIPEDITILLSQTSGHEYVSADHADLHNSYTMYLAHSENFANNIYCEADDSLESAKELCVADGGQDTGEVNDGYKLYLLSGNSTGGFGPKLDSSVTGTWASCPRFQSQPPADIVNSCVKNTYSNGITMKYVYYGAYRDIEIYDSPSSNQAIDSHGFQNGFQSFCEKYPYFEATTPSGAFSCSSLL